MRPDYRYPPAVLIDEQQLDELKALLKRLVTALEKIAEGKKP